MPALTKSYLQTGQVECRDTQGRHMARAGSGQDAEAGDGVAWRPGSRFRLQHGCVLDTAAGLCWLREAGYGEFPGTWQEGLDFIAQMNHGQVPGRRDWRLPNRRELHSLTSHQTSRPALPLQHPLENLFNGWYWTSTTAAFSPAHAWYVDMACMNPTGHGPCIRKRVRWGSDTGSRPASVYGRCARQQTTAVVGCKVSSPDAGLNYFCPCGSVILC